MHRAAAAAAGGLRSLGEHEKIFTTGWTPTFYSGIFCDQLLIAEQTDPMQTIRKLRVGVVFHADGALLQGLGGALEGIYSQGQLLNDG